MKHAINIENTNDKSKHQQGQAPVKTQSVAVIGSGISGLASAWFLSQEHQVTLFEKNAKLGGHTNTQVVPVAGKDQPVDTGFIVYNEPNYPHLTAMFAHLGVQTENTDMSFSVSINQGELEYSGNNLNTLFAQRKNLLSIAHWKMIAEIVRFNKAAKADLATQAAARQRSDIAQGNKQVYTGELAKSLGEYLDQHRISPRMREFYLLPMAAAIWSCPMETMMRFPAGSFLQFFENHGLLNIEDRPQWQTVSGGSQSYIDAILAQAEFAHHTDSAVIKVSEHGQQLRVELANGQSQLFDQVVMASHGDQSYRLLADELRSTFDCLQDFTYQKNIAYLHSDLALMPKRKLAWASWNYLRSSNHQEARVAVTYWMNLLQNIEVETPLLVTLNPLTPPRDALTYQRIVYEHPVFDQAALAAQAKIKALQGRHNLWFCGAYHGYGFHEDGLRSAVEIARQWNIALPWEAEKDGQAGREAGKPEQESLSALTQSSKLAADDLAGAA